MQIFMIITGCTILAFLAYWAVLRWRKIVQRKEIDKVDKGIFYGLLAVMTIFIIIDVVYYSMK